jgi:Lrp/AsnC family leucine-responsive transcriptional regulator/Lrp/AsnC family transcriptional regulator
LENDGVIKKYVAVIDREKVGKDLMVFCNIRLKEHAQEAGKKFVLEIVKLNEVIECHNISGEYDFMIKVVVEDMRSVDGLAASATMSTNAVNGSWPRFSSRSVSSSRWSTS